MYVYLHLHCLIQYKIAKNMNMVLINNKNVYIIKKKIIGSFLVFKNMSLNIGTIDMGEKGVTTGEVPLKAGLGYWLLFIMFLVVIAVAVVSMVYTILTYNKVKTLAC